jgi:hypothetical protein
VQVCRAGVGRPRKIWLTRHGESQFNTQGKIGGNSQLRWGGSLVAEEGRGVSEGKYVFLGAAGQRHRHGLKKCAVVLLSCMGGDGHGRPSQLPAVPSPL